jgi:hypothetical protein
LFLTACGGSDSPGVTSSGTNVTASGVPPCGIEGSGIHVQDCSNGAENQMPPPVTGLTMSTPRAEQTATLLSDGRVLIAGGFSSNAMTAGGKLASAEIYDPSTDTFTHTGDMTTARARHTATLLANGKVLIAGGVINTQQGTYLASAEIYDPSTGAFTATGTMIASDGWSQSTLLPDGRVLIVEDGNAEIYDPASGTFSLTSAYAGPLIGDTPTLLPNGRILVGETQLFDLQTSTFTVTGSLQPSGPTPQGWPNTATLLTNGTVLLVEGNDSGFPDNAFIYDPALGTLTFIGGTHSVHEFSTATRLPDGTVLIAGGQLPGGNGSTAVELYTPATGAFAQIANLTVGRHLHTATLLADGTVLIAGGYSVWPYPTSSAEIYK